MVQAAEFNKAPRPAGLLQKYVFAKSFLFLFVFIFGFWRCWSGESPNRAAYLLHFAATKATAHMSLADADICYVFKKIKQFSHEH